MSSLKPVEKRLLEEVFEMGGGYVLDFTNASFTEFFRDTLNVNIYDSRYEYIGNSKARRLRAFWEIESDAMVAKCLEELIECYIFSASLAGKAVPEPYLDGVSKIIARLSRENNQSGNSEEELLSREYKNIPIDRIGLEDTLVPILQDRLMEASHCLEKAPLATIFLCGSILEGVLLGVAHNNPRNFNQASSTPKRDGKPKPFQQWSLAQFIDVSHELGFLGEDIKKFGHNLRDFRNYIHPYQQLCSRFSPDVHTAKICLQVLKAAIVRLAENKR